MAVLLLVAMFRLLLLVRKTGKRLPHEKDALLPEMPTLVQNPETRKYNWKEMAVMKKVNPKDDHILFLPRLNTSPKPA